MKLVNAHKLTLVVLLFIIVLSGWNLLNAQEVWTLKQCIDTAQIHNKTLQINRNAVTIAGQREKEAKANLIPKITGNADYKYFSELPHQLMPMSLFNPAVPEGQFKEVQFGVPHNINANIQVAMPLYNAQIYGAIENTKLAGELSDLQYQKSEDQLLYDITILYYNAQILKHQLAFIDSNLVNTGKLLKNIRLMHEHLLVKSSDVDKVKLQSEQLNTQRENVNNRFVQILNALKLNMGVALEKDFTVEDDIGFKPALEFTAKENLDFQIIEIQNKILNTELNTLTKSKYLPSLNLMASYGTSGFGYDKKPNDFLNFYSVGFAGIQLTYPLFNGTVTKRKINQKKLEIVNNELQMHLISEKYKMENDNARKQRNVALRTISDTENQILLARAIYEQTVLQQKHGTSGLTDVLSADSSLRESQQNYLSAVIDYLKADLELKKITGNLFY